MDPSRLSGRGSGPAAPAPGMRARQGSAGPVGGAEPGGPIPPVIVIGMHRSGTSLVARMLEAAGVFMGSRKERNHEAVFFVALNDWLLRQAGGAWDHPEPVDRLVSHDGMRDLVVDYLRQALAGWPAWRYTGAGRRLLGETPLDMRRRWGWKDPRTTFTLPLWLEIFPGARILHVYRNGVDVASSLKVRVERSLEVARARHAERRRVGLYRLRLKRRGFVGSPACLDLSYAFALWEAYVSRAFGYGRRVEGAILHCRYEDLVADPAPRFVEVLSHCGLEADEGTVRAAASLVRPDRRLAYRQDESLRSFFETVRDTSWLRRLYGD